MSDDERERLILESDVYAKYGLRRKQLRHLERVRRAWPDHADTLTAFARYDESVALSHASVRALLDVMPASTLAALGVAGPRDIGRALAGQRAVRIEIVERATIRFVEVSTQLGPATIWLLTTHGVREAREDDTPIEREVMATLIAPFADAVENAMPGLGPLEEVLDAFERITGCVVVREGELGVGEEPPHVVANTLRFVAASGAARISGRAGGVDVRRADVVIDTSVPRVVR